MLDFNNTEIAFSIKSTRDLRNAYLLFSAIQSSTLVKTVNMLQEYNVNDGFRYVIDNIDNFELFSGTHNYESNQFLADLIDEKGLKRDDSRIYFAQLYGWANKPRVAANKG